MLFIPQVRLSHGGANGVFIDALHTDVTNCRIKRCGKGQDECCVVTKEDQQQFNDAHMEAIGELRWRMSESFDMEKLHLAVSLDGWKSRDYALNVAQLTHLHHIFITHYERELKLSISFEIGTWTRYV